MSKDELDPRLFDRDNGQGAAKEALESLMRTRDTNSPAIQQGHAQSTQEAAQEAQQLMGETSGFTGVDGEGVATFSLGLADVADVLQSHIDRATKR